MPANSRPGCSSIADIHLYRCAHAGTHRLRTAFHQSACGLRQSQPVPKSTPCKHRLGRAYNRGLNGGDSLSGQGCKGQVPASSSRSGSGATVATVATVAAVARGRWQPEQRSTSAPAHQQQRQGPAGGLSVCGGCGAVWSGLGRQRVLLQPACAGAVEHAQFSHGDNPVMLRLCCVCHTIIAPLWVLIKSTIRPLPLVRLCRRTRRHCMITSAVAIVVVL